MPPSGGSVINAGLHVFQNGKLPVGDLGNDSRPPTNMRLGGNGGVPDRFSALWSGSTACTVKNHVLRQF
jgi:hypothetical protein